MTLDSGMSHVGMLGEFLSARPPSYCPRLPRLKKSRISSSGRTFADAFGTDLGGFGYECPGALLSSALAFVIRLSKMLRWLSALDAECR